MLASFFRTAPDATRRQTQRLWREYGIFWIGAVLVGLAAVFYARLIDFGYERFESARLAYRWLPLLVTPLASALTVWLTNKFFRGAEGSGIPQVIAMLHHDSSRLARSLLSLKIVAGKVFLSFIAILGGLTIGREGPTTQLGAALMVNMRRFYPRSNAAIERQLALAGAAAGLSAAFNTPLAGIVFAIEELTRSFEQRASGVLITAIIFAGIVALALNGNYTYFGTIDIGAHFPNLLALAVVVTALVCGVAGGGFCWLLLNTQRWLPTRVTALRLRQPVIFAAACGFVVAVIGVSMGGSTFGSGYAQARALLEGQQQMSMLYPLAKFASTIGSYIPGIPGGIFAPSLSIGAGIGNVVHAIFSNMSLPMLIALAMVGYLAAVTQAPITSFVIVMEMINGHALVISLMATALVASRVSRLFAPPLYETLSARYIDHAPAAQNVVALENGGGATDSNDAAAAADLSSGEGGQEGPAAPAQATAAAATGVDDQSPVNASAGADRLENTDETGQTVRSGQSDNLIAPSTTPAKAPAGSSGQSPSSHTPDLPHSAP